MPRGAAFGHALDLWRSIRRDYEDFLEAEYERAAEACHDRLVNADGIARGTASSRTGTRSSRRSQGSVTRAASRSPWTGRSSLR